MLSMHYLADLGKLLHGVLFNPFKVFICYKRHSMYEEQPLDSRYTELHLQKTRDKQRIPRSWGNCRGLVIVVSQEILSM